MKGEVSVISTPLSINTVIAINTGSQRRNRPTAWQVLRTVAVWLHVAHLGHSLPLLPESCFQRLHQGVSYEDINANLPGQSALTSRCTCPEHRRWGRSEIVCSDIVWRACVQHRQTCTAALLSFSASSGVLGSTGTAYIGLFLFSPGLCWQCEDFILLPLEPVWKVPRVDFRLKGFQLLGVCSWRGILLSL